MWKYLKFYGNLGNNYSETQYSVKHNLLFKSPSVQMAN